MIVTNVYDCGRNIFFVPIEPPLFYKNILRHSSYFKKLRITYFDFSDIRLNKVLKGNAYHPYDRHPTALGHFAYSKLLEEELKKQYPQNFKKIK